MKTESRGVLVQEAVVVIGVPSSAGARRRGQERAPEGLRKAGLMERLRRAGMDCHDFGDLPLVRYEPDPDHPKCQNIMLVSAVAKQVADRVERAIQVSEKLLVVGGDCTITVGVLAGMRRRVRDLGLIYFDGDIDMNTPQDTPSGILDGMVLAHITGYVENELSRIDPSIPLMAEEKIAAFGYNLEAGWIDAGEKVRFDQSSVLKFPVSSLRDSILEKAIEARDQIKSRVAAYLIHFDVDVLDDLEFPVADVPHTQGVSLSAASTALQIFWSDAGCRGLVVSEFNSNRDLEGKYAAVLADLLVEVVTNRR